MSSIASHNSFTYMSVRKWWMWPFVWMARCQKIDTFEQMALGTRLFDIRLRFDKDGNPFICHGLIEFKSPANMLDVFLDGLQCLGDDFYVRMVLETSKTDEFQETCFKTCCETLQGKFPRIHFFGGNNRTDWGCKRPIYDFGTPLEDLDDKYSSTTNLFPFAWMRRLDDLCPILYARLHNKENIEKGTTHKWLFIDFVDIR